MECLRIVNGDIELDAGGAMSCVSGAERIKQDLACWILEPVGTDSAYPRFGSTLHESIGTPMWDSEIARVRGEVGRIVSNYIAYQTNEYQESARRSGKGNALYTWRDDDVLTGEYSMQVRVSDDTIRVNVTVVTRGGETIEIDEVV